MKKLMAVLLTIIAIPILTACGGLSGTTADLTVTPNSIALEQGIEKAAAFCDQRDKDLGTAKAATFAASAVGRVIDIPVHLVNTGWVALAGKNILAGTTSVRDAQCYDLRKRLREQQKE